MDQSIINFKVYEDSVEYVGMAQATLPDLTALTQSISGAGIAGNVESVILGHFDAMTLGLNFRTVTDQSVKLSEPRRHTIDLRVAQQDEDVVAGKVVVRAVKHILVVIPKSDKGGSVAPAAPSNGSGEYAVRYWATYIDGKKVREVDQLNFICYVNGTDYFITGFLVLLLGLISTGIVGMAYGTVDVFGWFGAMGKGMTGMGELIIVTLMAGGMLELIRFNGGVDYVLHRLTQHVKGKRGAELSIAALVSLANICTANNTIAIITVGPLANDIAEQFRVDKRKSASILDTFSCVIQGIIPYGAQLLIAAELSGLSPINIIGYLYYPMTLGVVAILSILFRYPRRYS